MITGKRIKTTAGRGQRTAIAVMAAGIASIQPAPAQESDGVTVDVAECIELESDAARLECFEAQVDAVLEQRRAEAPSETVPSTGGESGSTAGSTESREDSGGSETATRRDRREAERRDREARRAAAQEERAERVAAEQRSREERRASRSAESSGTDQEDASSTAEVVGTIVALEERLPDRYVITLDNGQVWEQTTPKRYLLRIGLPVTIGPSRWGTSYRLRGERLGGYIQVQRVR